MSEYVIAYDPAKTELNKSALCVARREGNDFIIVHQYSSRNEDDFNKELESVMELYKDALVLKQL